MCQTGVRKWRLACGCGGGGAMGSRVLRCTASAGALYGWLAGCTTNASAQRRASDDNPAMSEDRTNVERPASMASKLLLGTGEKWRFGVEGTLQKADKVLFEAGTARPPFQCNAMGAEGRAVEAENVGSRELELTRASTSSLLEGLRPLAGAWVGVEQQAQPEAVWITDARVQVLAGESTKDDLPALRVRLEQPLPKGTTMELPAYGGPPASMIVEYDCWHEGRAMVELRLTVLGDRGRSEDVCVKWMKVCVPGWQSLEIDHGKIPVFRGGAVTEGWRLGMATDGSHEAVTKLRLSSKGVERLRPPTVASLQKLLRVELRGPFYSGKSNAEIFEVTDDPVPVSVVYTCESDGIADVVLTLERAVLSDEHRPDQMQLQWRKLCGATTYQHLSVFLRSDTYRNNTQAVATGASLPGFMRRCRGGWSRGGVAAADGAVTGFEACEEGAPVFEVPPRDKRTSIELRVDREAWMEPPTLQPPPDLTYDRRLLQATLVQIPQSAASGGKHRSPQQKLLQSLTVKYTCFKDGVSVIMLTLHVLAHKPIDLAWHKRCTEPKTHVGKALTAPQALTITGIGCGIVAMICVLVVSFCGQEEKLPRTCEYAMQNGSGDTGSPGGLEFATRMGTKGNPGPTRFGAGAAGLDLEEEVTFH